MRNPITITVFLALIIVAGVFYVAHGRGQEIARQDAEQVRLMTAKFERQCRALLPTSPANQRNCVAESLAENRRDM